MGGVCVCVCAHSMPCTLLSARNGQMDLCFGQRCLSLASDLTVQSCLQAKLLCKLTCFYWNEQRAAKELQTVWIYLFMIKVNFLWLCDIYFCAHFMSLHATKLPESPPHIQHAAFVLLPFGCHAITHVDISLISAKAFIWNFGTGLLDWHLYRSCLHLVLLLVYKLCTIVYTFGVGIWI